MKKDILYYKFNEQMWEKYFPAAKKVINIDVLSYSVNQFINLIFPMLILVVGAVFTYYGHLSIGVVILFFTIKRVAQVKSVVLERSTPPIA